MDNFAICPLCGGEGVGLGALGNLFHSHCRQCGLIFSEPIQHRHDAVDDEPETVVITEDE